MTYMLDGKQYIVIAGGPIQGGGGGPGGAGAAKGKGAPAAPAAPPISRMVALVLDGTKPLPGVPAQ